MLSGVLKQNRIQLEKASSYLLPHMDKLLRLLKDLENNAGPDYYDAFQRFELKKGEYLLKAGDSSHHIWFLEKGIARVFLNKNGLEVNRYFFFPGEPIEDFCSFVQEAPSHVCIQVICKSVVYATTRETMKKLQSKYPVIAEIERLIVDCHAVWLEEQIYRIQCSTAEARYKYLSIHQITWLQNIPLIFLASYLGIALETLSRIRKTVALGVIPE